MGITIQEIDDKLQSLSEEKLAVVYDFVMHLSEEKDSDIETALLSEASLARDWNTPEEDKAWQHLDALPSC
jgi:hypothetical protein